MLEVVCNWFYIIVVTFLLGIWVRSFCRKYLEYEITGCRHIMAAGMVAAGIYAQIFSLFYKVSFLANVILSVICFIIFWCHKEEVKKLTGSIVPPDNLKKNIWIFANMIFWVYFTSRGIMHYDSDLYHAQSIRWIEEYGIVPGLGNLHVRFAYNNAFFPLSALFSMKFMTGQSLHTVNGFFAFLLGCNLYPLFEIIKRKKVILSDFARIGAFYYLSIICQEIVAPASDYAAMCTIFYIVTAWLDELEKEKKTESKTAPYALLCVAMVFAITLKLTTGVILLLVIKPAYELIRNKKWKEIAIYILMGVTVIAPWMIRTVIISGYLLYPFPAIDIFNVDWKISAVEAARDAAEIKAWGRGLYDADKVKLSVLVWGKEWFLQLATTEKALILSDIISIILCPVILLISVIKKKTDMQYLLLIFCIAGNYLFWQFSAPLIRYGYCYVILLSILTAGFIFLKAQNKIKWLYKLMITAALLMVLYRGIPVAKQGIAMIYQPYLLAQKDYGIYEVKTYQIDGMTIFYPANGDQAGYEPFPASTTVRDIQLRGQDISEGFKSRY